jgi:hypothetical protein
LLKGCWVLGNSAFPRIPGKMKRIKKKTSIFYKILQKLFGN